MGRALVRALVAAWVAVSVLGGEARAAWQDSPKVKALYEAAKKEGKVVVWGTHPREVSWIPAAFGKFFPDITVEFLGDNDIAVKAIAEARAGRHQLDVFWSSLTGTLDRKSTRLNSSHLGISYAVFCLKKKKHDT